MSAQHGGEELKEPYGSEAMHKVQDVAHEVVQGGNILNASLMLHAATLLFQAVSLLWLPDWLLPNFLSKAEWTTDATPIVRCFGWTNFALALVAGGAVMYSNKDKALLNSVFAVFHAFALGDAFYKGWYKTAGLCISPSWFHVPLGVVSGMAGFSYFNQQGVGTTTAQGKKHA